MCQGANPNKAMRSWSINDGKACGLQMQRTVKLQRLDGPCPQTQCTRRGRRNSVRIAAIARCRRLFRGRRASCCRCMAVTAADCKNIQGLRTLSYRMTFVIVASTSALQQRLGNSDKTGRQVRPRLARHMGHGAHQKGITVGMQARKAPLNS